MPDNCTLYCATNDLETVERLLEETFPGTLSVAEDEGQSRCVAGLEGSLRLTPKAFQERGDAFCRLLLSTNTYMERRTEGEANTKKSLSQRILKSQLTLGVVVEPDVNVDERYNDVIFAIAQSLDAVIFNGSQFMSATGDVIVEQSH
jgi:hypothetical protein